ncbi:MAG: hypothetical protein RLZZ104_2039 [Pseudomonadota bacterium]|jgi:SOS-response transcriptional repressor LexA
MGTGLRIEQRRNELGLTQEQLAHRVKRLGGSISQTGIDKIEKRDSQRPRYLKELAIALDVSEDWLTSGKEPKERPSQQSPGQIVDVPILSWVSAGALTKPDVSADQIGVYRAGDLDPRGDWIALRVDGDSMDRISPPGSVILVNRKEKQLIPNACYVVADGDHQVTYKRFRPNPHRLEPVSTNPAHEPIFYDHEPLIIGRVRKTLLDM